MTHPPQHQPPPPPVPPQGQQPNYGPPPQAQPNYAPPPGYGQPPTAPQARQGRPWYKRKRFMIPLGLVGFGVIGSAFGGGADTTTTTVNTSPGTSVSTSKAPAPAAARTTAEPEQPAGAGIGDPVRDGKFQFTVSGVKYGVKSVGTNPYLTKKPQGAFALVKVKVENIGDEPQTLFSSNQFAYIEDRKYSVDDEATMYTAPGGDSVWLKEINPGNTMSGTLVFDLPKGKKIERLELHDSAFSGGIEVRAS